MASVFLIRTYFEPSGSTYGLEDDAYYIFLINKTREYIINKRWELGTPLYTGNILEGTQPIQKIRTAKNLPPKKLRECTKEF